MGGGWWGGGGGGGGTAKHVEKVFSVFRKAGVDVKAVHQVSKVGRGVQHILVKFVVAFKEIN